MTKKELIKTVAESTELTQKQATAGVESVFATIKKVLSEGDSVSIAGFGSFEVRDRAEKPGYNPSTGESIIIPARKAPAFKASKILKDLVNG